MIIKLTNKSIASLNPRARAYDVRDAEIKGFLLRVEPTGSLIYHLVYKNKDGHKRRFRIGKHGTLTAAQAREAANLLAADVAKGLDVQEDRKGRREQAQRDKARTLSAFINNGYGEWLRSSRKSGKATIDLLNKQFASLLNRSMDDITHWDIEKWRKSRLDSGIKPATINRNITALKAALSKAVEWDVIASNPLQRLKQLKIDEHGVTRYLTTEEERALRHALILREEQIRQARIKANRWREERSYALKDYISDDCYADHLHPMVLLSLNTGLRRNELFQLRWSDLDSSYASLCVRGAYSKSGKTRFVPLNNDAKAVLKRWKASYDNNDELVFPSKDGKPFDNVNKAWSGLLQLAGIKRFRWHDMRHHFASRLVMAGVDLNTVRELLGHSTLNMTLRYAHLAPEHKVDAVNRICGAQL